MDFMCRGSASPKLSCYQPVAHVQCVETKFELLTRVIECLYKMRDAIKEEIVKGLIWGKAPSKECRKWLEKVEEIEHQVNDMSEMQKKSSQLHPHLMNILNEITEHMDKFPLVPHVMAYAQHAKESDVYRPVKTSKNLNLDIKSETKGVQNVRAEKTVARGKKTAPRKKQMHPMIVKRNQRTVAEEVELTPPQRSEVTSVISSESEVALETAPSSVWKSMSADLAPASSVEAASTQEMISQARTGILSTHKSEIEFVSLETEGFSSMHQTEVARETAPSSVRKFMSADLAPASSVEAASTQEMISPARTGTLSTHKSEIKLVSLETEGFLSMHQTEATHDENERVLSVHGTETSVVLSHDEGGQTKSELRSVEPTMPIALFTSGPSNKAAVDSKKMPPLRKKVEVSAIHLGEIDIPCPSEGSQSFLEPGVLAKRSIEHTVWKILGCLSDDTTRRIGVYGIGGIGKTSVLKALINHLEIKSMFDVVIWVTVSRYWSRRKLQNEVLRQLSLSLSDFETDSKIAEKLFLDLYGRKFLLLLDDVWEWIDLTELGIPHLSSENGCKMILATRLLDVCLDMADRVIEVETLSREEAWDLFHEQVGGIVYSPDINPFAQAIVEDCGGLPLLIIVTGRALTKEIDVTVWKQALKEILLPSTLGVCGIQAVIQQLKLSYDRLKACDIKSCFLYCALFSEDEDVDILKFVEYCIQEGLLTGSWAAACKRGHDIIDVLVRASLLQSTNGGHSIQMHNMIRDLALGILSSDAEGCQFLLRAYSRPTEPLNSRSVLSSRPCERPESNRLCVPDHGFFLRAGACLTEPPLRKEEWEQAKMIFLMDNELSTLPETPNCPNLLTLFFQRNDRLRAIPMSFFDFMPSLKVLNLSRTRIKSLPHTLSKLIELQVLILRDCERLVMLPSQIESLQYLEVLDLRGTEINILPDEVGNLAFLRHLEVTFYGSVNPSEYVNLPHKLISRGIISRLNALQTLSIGVHPGDQRWNECVNFVTNEVSHLTELTSLCFYFPEVELLELFLRTSKAWNTQCLADFKFVVGQDFKCIVLRVPHYVEYDYAQQGQCLRFVNGEKIPDAIVKVLACSTSFYLDNHLDICSVSKFGVSNINGLKFCIVSECPKIETIVDSKELTTLVFPCLENLSLHYLWNLTSICEGMVPKGSFAGLRILSVHACPKLKYVFTSSMLQFVSHLEQLVVEDCPHIEEIIFNDMNIESGSLFHLGLKKLTLHYLPGLVNIWKGALPSLEHVSFYNCPNLKKIGIDRWNHFIKEIKAEKDWWDALEWEEAAFSLHLQACFTSICDDDFQEASWKQIIKPS